MAKLHRFVKLKDRFDSQVFTFLLPNSLINDFSKDVYNREFAYGQQHWILTVGRNDKHMSVSVTLKNVTHGMRVTVDLMFVLINREHFTRHIDKIY